MGLFVMLIWPRAGPTSGASSASAGFPRIHSEASFRPASGARLVSFALFSTYSWLVLGTFSRPVRLTSAGLSSKRRPASAGAVSPARAERSVSVMLPRSLRLLTAVSEASPASEGRCVSFSSSTPGMVVSLGTSSEVSEAAVMSRSPPSDSRAPRSRAWSCIAPRMANSLPIVVRPARALASTSEGAPTMTMESPTDWSFSRPWRLVISWPSSMCSQPPIERISPSPARSGPEPASMRRLPSMQL